MKILIITTTKQLTGLNYHRQIIPHNHLVANFDGYNVDYADSIDWVTDEQLKDYQIVSFLRLIQGNIDEQIERIKRCGCKVILDIDDYWVLHEKHALKQIYNDSNTPQITIDSIKAVDYITTTTEHFADKIREYNRNVTVIPNSIDATVDQFKTKAIPSERTRIGWIGGSFHLPDISLISSGFSELWKGISNDKFQLILGGYLYPDKIKYLTNEIALGNLDEITLSRFNFYLKQLENKVNVPDVLIFNNIYQNVPENDLIEFFFTVGNKYPRDKEYWNYLNEKKCERLELMENKPYKRLWAMHPYNYAEMYNDIDVALVPLVENNFNSYKSQIKIIEAGWFNKAVIVSNVMPYTIDCNSSNSILISPNKRNEGWGVAMKSLVLNPNKREDLAAKLHEEVRAKYNMNDVNKVRNELYKWITE